MREYINRYNELVNWAASSRLRTIGAFSTAFTTVVVVSIVVAGVFVLLNIPLEGMHPALDAAVTWTMRALFLVTIFTGILPALIRGNRWLEKKRGTHG